MTYTNFEYELDEPFIFMSPDRTRFGVQVVTASFKENDGEIVECRFEVRVTPEIYMRIHHEALFNLSPEVSPSLTQPFDLNKPIQIELALHANYLGSLSDGVSSIDEVLNRLFVWSRADDPALTRQPILSTQSWYALNVKQAVDLPEELQSEGSQLFTGFATHWSEPDLETDFSEPLPGSSTDHLTTFCAFFQSQGWLFTRIKGRDDVVELSIKSNHYVLNCRAFVNRSMDQCAFYSFAPGKVSVGMRAAAVEFIMRANYGLIIGNLEMDWINGDVRCKTSIDVHGDDLSIALIQNLVEANVALMDLYLPGLQAVMTGELTAAAAIAKCEN